MTLSVHVVEFQGAGKGMITKDPDVCAMQFGEKSNNLLVWACIIRLRPYHLLLSLWLYPWIEPVPDHVASAYTLLCRKIARSTVSLMVCTDMCLVKAMNFRNLNHGCCSAQFFFGCRIISSYLWTRRWVAKIIEGAENGMEYWFIFRRKEKLLKE